MQEKGRAQFMGLVGPQPFHLSQKLDLEIKWVCDDAVMENIGCVCEFIDPPPDCAEKIRRMVNDFLAGGMRERGGQEMKSGQPG